VTYQGNKWVDRWKRWKRIVQKVYGIRVIVQEGKGG